MQPMRSSRREARPLRCRILYINVSQAFMNYKLCSRLSPLGKQLSRNEVPCKYFSNKRRLLNGFNPRTNKPTTLK